MITNVESQQFYMFFMGKSNTYVKNILPKKKPALGEKVKTTITNHEGKVDKDLLGKHLDGMFGVGICPVDSDGKCRFAVIDIDYYKSKINKMLDFIREHQLPLVPFRSKSGGIHTYLFLKKAESAKKVRNVLQQVIYFLSLDNIYGNNKVEIFPKQDKAEGYGSAITLPYFNAEDTYTYMLDLDGNSVSFKDALSIIPKKFTSVAELQGVLDNLAYNDAPPCLQRAIIANEIGSEDSGRNNFLFSFAVYAKKKYGVDFESYVKEINDAFECPLKDSTLQQICTSVANNEYMYKCKDIPCKAYCDKGICKKREYGLGRDKSHFTGVDYGQLYRYKTAEPYYIWKLRLNGQEDWKDVVFKDEGFLLDQKNFAKMCVRYLNQAPMQVSNNDWYAVLNSVLPNIQDVEVKKESDTSGLSLLQNTFLSYLANKQARRDSPYQIKVGLCVRQAKKDLVKYYFTHRGFTDYLRSQKINFDCGMLRETLKGFGAEEDILQYVNAFGEEVSFPCWSKVENESLEEAYLGALEVEQGDKKSISDATNIEETIEEKTNIEEYMSSIEDEEAPF